MPIRIYHRRGLIERWSSEKRAYVYREGFSEDGPNGGEVQPWKSQEECRAEAERAGAWAHFEYHYDS